MDAIRSIPAEKIKQLQADNAALRQQLARSEELLEYEKTSNQNNVEMYEMRCRELEKHSKQLIIALKELVDLMQGVIDGDYEPDSFTLQFAREVLKGIPESIENQPTCEERLARLVEAARRVIKISDRKHDAWDDAKQAIAAVERHFESNKNTQIKGIDNQK